MLLLFIHACCAVASQPFCYCMYNVVFLFAIVVLSHPISFALSLSISFFCLFFFSEQFCVFQAAHLFCFIANFSFSLHLFSLDCCCCSSVTFSRMLYNRSFIHLYICLCSFSRQPLPFGSQLYILYCVVSHCD